MRFLNTQTFLLLTSLPAPLLYGAEGAVLDSGAQVDASILFLGGSDDNVALTNDNELSSSFFESKGQFSLLMNPGSFEHLLDISFNDRRYQDSKADNFTDWNASYLGHFEPTSRHRSDFNVSISKRHQQRGVGYTRYLEIPLSAPLEYSISEVELSHEYGSLTASGRVGVAVRYDVFSFDNFSEFTDRLNYSSPQVKSWFNYDVGAVTSLSFDISYQNTDYVIADPDGSRDAVIMRALVGTIWSGLAKTTGKVKLGYEKRNFDDDARTDYGGLAVDIGITWKPRTYSALVMELTRRTSESGFSDLILDTTFNLSWEHSWSDVSATSMIYQFLNRDEQGNFKRTEKRNYVGAAYSKQIAKWLTLNAEYNITLNRSTEAIFDYDNQVFMLGIRGFL